MTRFVSFSLILCYVAVAQGFFFHKKEEGDVDTINQSWNDFRITWDPKLLIKNALGSESLNGHRLDRKVTIPSDSECVTSTGKTTWYGHRFSVSGDSKGRNAVVRLYDNNGMVAGIQARFAVSTTKTPGNNFKYDEVPMFQKEIIGSEEYYVLTAYFVDPEIICTGGRPESDFDTNFGTGDRLVFQNGATPQELLNAPKLRTDALKAGYSDNNCFSGMGSHTFYGVEEYESHECSKIVPVFLLFNKAGYMHGFGFSWTGLGESDFFEQPPSLAVRAIVGKSAPKCLLDGPKTNGVRTMHTFFVKNNPCCSKLCNFFTGD